MAVSGVLKPEGNGLQFKTQQGSLGDIRLAVDGRIPNLDRPLALEGNFDIGLPSLTLLSFLAPDAKLPDLPFTAVGELRNRKDTTQFQNVRLTLGTIATEISGELRSDRGFDLTIEAGGPDASVLQPWVRQTLAPEPFSLRTHVFGNPDAFQLADIDAQLGKSRAGGDLAIGLGLPKTVNGKLASPFLDLSEWNSGGEAEEQPTDPKPSSGFVFDDTKVMWVEDYGVDADVTLSVDELDLGNTRLLDIELGVLLGRNQLELAPFSLRGERGGTLTGHAVLDGSGAKPVLDLEMNGKDLRLGLTAVPGQEKETIPALELILSLHGSGYTRREMASSLDGKVRAYLGPGQIANSGINFLFSDFLTELFNTLNPLAETNDYTSLECTAWAADIVAGRVTVDPMITQMEDFTILSKGTVDLQTEKINLSFNTKPRKGLGITPGTVINTLIKVGGTLKKPSIELDPAGAIVGGTAAVATAGLSIVAKSFADRFLSSKDPCGDARKEIAKRDM
jgi:AsmA protein